MNLRDAKLDSLSTNNIDMRGRRSINASASVDLTDYVIQSELNDAIATALSSLSSGSQTSTDVVTPLSIPLKSPLDFGGVGDGSTDDTAAVAAASLYLDYLWLPAGYT